MVFFPRFFVKFAFFSTILWWNFIYCVLLAKFAFSFRLFDEMHFFSLIFDQIGVFVQFFEKIHIFTIIWWKQCFLRFSCFFDESHFFPLFFDEMSIFFAFFWRNLRLFSDPLTIFTLCLQSFDEITDFSCDDTRRWFFSATVCRNLRCFYVRIFDLKNNFF